MPSFPDPDNNRNDKIDFIIAHRFGNAVKAVKRLGPLLTPGRPGEKPPDISAALAAEKKLAALTDDELEAEYRAVRKAIARAQEEHLKREAERRERDEAKLPFNFQGDFAYWAKCPYWSIEEAVALVLGRDPKYANWKSAQPYLQISTGARLYIRTLELANRSVAWKQLTNPTALGAFIVWAKRYEIHVPAGLETEVGKYGHFIGDWKTLYDMKAAELDAAHEREKQLADLIAKTKAQTDALMIQTKETMARLSQKPPTPKEADPREITSLRKLCIGMAIRGYRFDPNESRNSAVTEIVGDLELLGIRVSPDTVRKHLAEGAELLPQDWRQVRLG